MRTIRKTLSHEPDAITAIHQQHIKCFPVTIQHNYQLLINDFEISTLLAQK